MLVALSYRVYLWRSLTAYVGGSLKPRTLVACSYRVCQWRAVTAYVGCVQLPRMLVACSYRVRWWRSLTAYIFGARQDDVKGVIGSQLVLYCVSKSLHRDRIIELETNRGFSVFIILPARITKMNYTKVIILRF